jgi:AraC-like DNA-binding protein
MFAASSHRCSQCLEFQRWSAALASLWEQSAPPSENLLIPFVGTDPFDRCPLTSVILRSWSGSRNCKSSRRGCRVATVLSEPRTLTLSWSEALRGAELYVGQDVRAFATDWHFHEGLQLVAVIRGERNYEFKSGSIVAQPGQLVIVPPRLVHRAHCPDGSTTSFRIATLPSVCLNAAIPESPLAWSTTKLFDSFLSIFESLKEEGRHGPTATIISGVETLLSESNLASTLPTSSIPAFVLHIEAYLLRSFDRIPSLSFLSSLAGVSPYHLTHSFTKHVGLSPLAYHARARLMRSRKLIAQGCSLTETSLSLSFSDQSHFGRQFKRVYGMTPGQYQQSLASA